MIEASGFDRLDNVFLFHRAVIDNFCGFTDTAEISTIFTSYVDILKLLFRVGQPAGWNNSDIETLKILVIEFKRGAGPSLGKDQPSEIKTQK